MPLLLTNEDILPLIDMRSSIDALETAYRGLGTDKASNRVRSVSMAPHEGTNRFYECVTMEGTIFPLEVHAIRINSEIQERVEIAGTWRRREVPTLPGDRFLGVVLLFSTRDAGLLAIIHDAIISGLRVGATSALAARHMAREDARIMALLGSGTQARAQALGMAAVRPLEQIRVYSPNQANRESFAAEMAERLGIEVIAVSSGTEAVRGADIVDVATNASTPVLLGEWLEPGQHLTALVGGDSKFPRREVDDEAVARCDRIVVHDAEYARRSNQPDIETAVASGQLSYDSLESIVDLVTASRPVPRKPEDITYFKNNTGMGLQFAALGQVLYERARAEGVGREVPLEWFTQAENP